MVHLGRIRLLNVLAEAALIVFSILLALSANHWRDERAAQRKTAVALQDIHTELQQNCAILADMAPYHAATAAAFGKYLQLPDLARRMKARSFDELQDKLMSRGVWNPGVKPSNLSDAAWKSAWATGAVSGLRPELLKALTNYYADQENGVQDTLRDLLHLFMTSMPYDRDQTQTALRTLRGSFQELGAEETQLLTQCKQTADAVEPAVGKH